MRFAGMQGGGGSARRLRSTYATGRRVWRRRRRACYPGSMRWPSPVGAGGELSVHLLVLGPGAAQAPCARGIVRCLVISLGLRGTARPARRRERIAARGRRGGAAPAPPRLECHRGVQCDTAPLPAHMPRVDHRGLPGADAADRSDQAADQPRLAPERDRRLRLGLDHGATPRKRPAHRRLHRRADVWQKSDFQRRGLRIFGNGGLTRPRPHHSFLKSCPETNKQSTSRSPRIGHYDIDKFLQARAISIRHLDSVEGLIFLHSIGLPPF